MIDKIKAMIAKKKLNDDVKDTDQGDLIERTTVIETNNPFKKIKAIAEPKESKNRSVLNALINDGADDKAKLDDASKNKMIKSLVMEMYKDEDMSKKEFDFFMNEVLAPKEMNKGGRVDKPLGAGGKK
tara:strand:+ start:127 stop:510 length:384 start_codon:yes stop_codon:yes gene_type:complete